MLDVAELDEDSVQLPDEVPLTRLSKLVLEHLELEREILTLEKELAKKKEDLFTLNEKTIPDLFVEIGLTEIKLDNGAKVSVNKYYAANISGERESAAFKWLRESGHDDLIKNELKLNFGKGEDQTCNALADALADQGYNFTTKVSVHPQTLKAFVKEQIESANPDFNEDTQRIFGVFIGAKTKIKLGKGGTSNG